MAEITAGLVKELREMTGLGMMECKKALTEANGDLKKAEELLRIKSGAKAGKAASRIAAEGVIGAYLSPDAKSGALVELNCETDFVAKNDDFVVYAQVLAELVATKNPADVAALVAYPGIEAQRQSMVQKIGENISIRRFSQMNVKENSPAKLSQYVNSGRIGVLLEYEGADDVGRTWPCTSRSPGPPISRNQKSRPTSLPASATSSRRAQRNRASRRKSSPRWSTVA